MQNAKSKPSIPPFNPVPWYSPQPGFFTGQHSIFNTGVHVLVGMLLADNSGLRLCDFVIELKNNGTELCLTVTDGVERTQTPRSAGEELFRFIQLNQNVDFRHVVLYIVKNISLSHIPTNTIEMRFLITSYQSLLYGLTLGTYGT